MSGKERDALNAAITKAIKEGLRPFPCWSCRGWFVQTYTTGRPRVVCDDPICQRHRQAFTKRGWTAARPLTFPNKSHLRAELAGWSNRHPAQLIFEEVNFSLRVGNSRQRTEHRVTEAA